MLLLTTTADTPDRDWFHARPVALGMRVRAALYLEENYCDGRGVIEVARPGDWGTVEHLNVDGVPTVRFDCTGRATLCWVGPTGEVL